jgi:hypothetical protein
MAGNVREWCLNQDTRARQPVSIGGDWQDPDYIFSFATALPPMDRSAGNGFRLMREIDGSGHTAGLDKAFTLPGRSYIGEAPVADDVFDAYAGQYAYQRGDAHAGAVETLQTTGDWRKERVEIDTGYNGRMAVYLFVPINGHPPFQPLIYFPDVGPFMNPSPSNTLGPGFRNAPLDFVVKSGRVLVQPVYQGSYERCCFALFNQTLFARATIDRGWDIGRTLDYLESRPELIDMKHAGFIGTSFGATFALPHLAVERRFHAAVLISGGLPTLKMLPEIDPLNFASRITLPVLMINGRYDQLSPKVESQETLFRLLGTQLAKKRYCVVERGHGDIPRSVLLRETLGWLDYYLGDPDPHTADSARVAPAGGRACEVAN